MAKTRENFLTKIAGTIQDDAGILTTTGGISGEGEVGDFLDEAIKTYNKDKPRERIEETAGDTGYDYGLPSDWDDDFSAIVSKIEYPIDQYQEPSFVDDNDWIFLKGASATTLRFLTISPQSGYSFRYTYTVPHTVSASANTVPEGDFDAVCNLSSSLCCRALAAKYAQTSEPTIEADVVDYARKADDYTALADKLEELYNRHVGKGPPEEIAKPGASVTRDTDIQYAFGSDYITHPKRWR